MRLLQEEFVVFGSQADVAISVFRTVSGDTMFPRLRCHCRRMFRIRILRKVCWCKHFCGNQPLTRRAYLPMDPSCPPCHPRPVPSLRHNTESEDELAAALRPDARDASGPDDSGDGVVEHELLPELTDNRGTTRGTKLSVLQIMLFPFGVNRGS